MDLKCLRQKLFFANALDFPKQLVRNKTKPHYLFFNKLFIQLTFITTIYFNLCQVLTQDSTMVVFTKAEYIEFRARLSMLYWFLFI